MRALSRLIAIPVVLALGLALTACQKSGGYSAQADDMSLGNPDAKVTVVEYASVGCPICAKWQQDTYPAFKAKYIDTGKIHYVFREMLVGGEGEVALAASGFLLARCSGKDKYFPVVDAIFDAQAQAFQAPRETLANIAKSMGMTDQQYQACISDDKALKDLNARVQRHIQDDKVDATPTFVINGKALPAGPQPLSKLDEMISAASK
jgi:protein-disulfide isomerase